MGMCSLFLSLKTPNADQLVAELSQNIQVTSKGCDKTLRNYIVGYLILQLK